MSQRSYDQFCPAARALDLVGTRWTMLIVRDLLLGPQRFTDLLAGLPGVGPNVLTDRLRKLRDCGVVRQAKLPPPAASTVYELTELGEELRPVVNGLQRWGLRLLDGPRPGERVQLGWLLGCLRATFRPELARGVHESYEFLIDGEPFHIRVDDGAIDVRHGAAADPACSVETDVTTFMALGARLITVQEATTNGLARCAGDPLAGARSIAILGPHFDATGTAHGILGAVRARFQPDATHGVRENYEFRIGAEVFHSRVDDGRVEMRLGPTDDAAASLTADLATFLAIGAGTRPIAEAIKDGSVTIGGDRDALARMAAAFGVARGDQNRPLSAADAQPQPRR